MTTELSRRDFLKSGAVAGAGLTLSFTLPLGGGPRQAQAASAFEPNASLILRVVMAQAPFAARSMARTMRG